ncbi:PD-(D/E)XK nuclease family protein [bacterium]|nr:PD-(D/E)XK nuclease family protein [bacterium]
MSEPLFKYISQSLLNMAGKCGMQVYHRHIKGIIIPPGFAAHRGTAVHKAAQADAEAKREKQSEFGLTVAEMIDVAADAFEKKVSEDGVYLNAEEAQFANTLKADAKDTAIVATKLYGNEVAKRIRTPKLIEETVTMDVDGLSYPLGGTIDLVHVADGKHRIQDIKTTEKRMFDGIATHTLQAPLYTMLAESVLDGETPDFDYEYLVIQKTKQDNVTIPAIVNKQSRVNIVERARVLERALQAGIFQPAPRDAWWCSEKSCGYWGICPFGAKQTVQVAL